MCSVACDPTRARSALPHLSCGYEFGCADHAGHRILGHLGHMTTRSISALLRHDLSRYFAASLVALALDVAVLSLCLRALQLSLAWSASIGFVAGAIVAYLLSIRWVFRNRAFGDAPALEFLTFVGIGVAGLGVTQLVLWLGVTQLHVLAELVKLSAAGITFVFNYLVRRSMLFAATRRTAPIRKDVA